MELPLDRLMEKAMKEHIPIRAMIELTHRCNLSCSHCYIAPTSSKELTQAEIKTLLKDLSDLGTIFLTLTGGEILVRNDFFDTCWYARELGFVLHIKTNGTLINKGRAKEISRLSPMSLDVSLYGADAKSHDSVTGVKGSFNASIRAVKQLAALEVPVLINTVLMRRTSSSYSEIRDLAESLGVGFQVDPVVVTKSDGSAETIACRANDSCLADFMIDMLDDYSKSVPANKAFDEAKEARPCATGSTSVFVSADGIVSPCVLLRLNCGNVRDSSICDIWHTSEQLSQVRDIRMKHLTACSQCDLLGYCRRCTGVAYLEDQDMYGCSAEARRQAMIYKTLITAGLPGNGLK
ncbi:MAG: radical SAM protein [Actinobacteria bacterium]|nr:radical SAM protein [Actinomycetota bacterium]